MSKMPSSFGRLVLSAIIFTGALITAVPATAAIGTAFTYQGRVAESGTTVTGVLDLQFELYDDPVTGSSVGGPISLSDVTCSDGLFTVTLDFGPVQRSATLAADPGLPRLPDGRLHRSVAATGADAYTARDLCDQRDER